MQGVNYAYFEGKWEKLPDFDKMQPVKRGKLNQVDLSPRQRDDNFGIKFDAYVKVMSAGVYNFSVKSDNGSRLYIDSKIVVDNDGNDVYDTRGEIRLDEGVHPVTLDAARDGYAQLKKIAPYSPATVEAREAITKAVRGKKPE